MGDSSLGGGPLTGIFGSGITHEKYLEFLQFHINKWLPFIILNAGASVFLVGSFFVACGTKAHKTEKFWLLFSVLLIVILYFLSELNIIDKVHDYYLMPFLIPFTIMVTSGIKLFYNFSDLTRYLSIIFLLSLPLLAYDEVQKYWTLFSDGDIYKYHKELRNAVPKDAICVILNDDSGCVYSYQIDKQGFIYNNDNIPAAYFEDMIKNRNATYLYCNSRKVDERPEIKIFFESEVVKYGAIHVYKLKKL